jgi:2-polyprenyl-3-methyl-5-hydroxy-6-metoxy-1,4-benzoquinol methylase
MKLYERYHSKRKLQRFVIDDKNFVYRSLIYFLKKYQKNSKNVLDIGCGVGTIDFYIAKHGSNVTGIDISQNSISIAKKNAEYFKLNKKIVFKVLKFPDEMPQGKFDIIICSEVLEHLNHDKVAVKKIKTLLQKGGILIASSPSQNSLFYRWGLLNKFEKEVGHLRRYTEESFKNLFENAGFKILETKKTEGILRNLLFTNPIGGFLLKILKRWPFSVVTSCLDDLMIPIFGESDIYLVAQNK